MHRSWADSGTLVFFLGKTSLLYLSESIAGMVVGYMPRIVSSVAFDRTETDSLACLCCPALAPWGSPKVYLLPPLFAVYSSLWTERKRNAQCVYGSLFKTVCMAFTIDGINNQAINTDNSSFFKQYQ